MLTNRKSLADAAPFIADGDVLLFRRPPGSIVAKAICVSGRSDYSHAAMAGWLRPSQSSTTRATLCCLEVREGVGGRVVTLASQVEKFDGLIDVYAAASKSDYRDYDRDAAVMRMLEFAGQPYGWLAIARAARSYLPFLRWFFDTNENDQWYSSAPVFCSEAVSRAMRVGGRVDPVVNLADCDTEPGDLARSDVLEYRFTLEP